MSKRKHSKTTSKKHRDGHRKSKKKATKKLSLKKVKIPPRLGTRKLTLSLSVEEKDGLKRMFKFNKEACYWDRILQKWKVDVDFMKENGIKLKLLVHWLSLKQLRAKDFPGGPKLFKRLGGEEAREIREAIEEEQRFAAEAAKKNAKRRRNNESSSEDSSTDDETASTGEDTETEEASSSSTRSESIDSSDTAEESATEADEEDDTSDSEELEEEQDDASEDEVIDNVVQVKSNKRKSAIPLPATRRSKKPKLSVREDGATNEGLPDTARASTAPTLPLLPFSNHECDTRGCSNIAARRCPFDGLMICQKHAHHCTLCEVVSCKKQKTHKVHKGLEINFPSSLMEDVGSIPISEPAALQVTDD